MVNNRVLDEDHPDPFDRIQGLLEENDPALHGVLLEGIEHADRAVRVYCALLLAELFHDVRALPGLHEALVEWDREVQDAAAEAVWEIGDADPSTLIQALHFERGSVRDAVAGALALVGWFPDDPDMEVAYRIATRDWRALVSLGPAAVPGLAAALRDPDGNIRRGAAWALGEIGDPRAVPVLVAALADTSGDMFGIGGRVCDVAADALLRIGSPEAKSAVEQWRSA